MLNAKPLAHGKRASRGRVVMPPAPSVSTPPAVYPYEYVVTFPIEGRPGNIAQSAIAVSVDASFVAMAVSYGFEEDRGRPLALQNRPKAPFSPAGVVLSELPLDALVQGVRIAPSYLPLLFPQPIGPAPKVEPVISGQLPSDAFDKFLQAVKSQEDLTFLFSMVDTSSGRELQDQPTLSLASLGGSSGKRPFRALARPLSFLPRSTLRMQIVERTSGVRGTLFVVVHGYKVGAGCAPPPILTGQGPSPSGRVVPFDYVSSVALTGRSGNVLTDEIPINTEGNFVVTSVGYGLQVDTNKVTINRSIVRPGSSVIDLQTLPLSAFTTKALIGGFRIRPSFVRIAIANNQLNTGVSLNTIDQVFEPLNRVEDVSFRYSFFDTGAGRDLQNQPVYNVAGLGTATGERPFKPLARPLTLLPRSSLRVTVEERFGFGQLYIVFQGYKLLGGQNPGGR